MFRRRCEDGVGRPDINASAGVVTIILIATYARINWAVALFKP